MANWAEIPFITRDMLPESVPSRCVWGPHVKSINTPLTTKGAIKGKIPRWLSPQFCTGNTMERAPHFFLNCFLFTWNPAWKGPYKGKHHNCLVLPRLIRSPKRGPDCASKTLLLFQILSDLDSEEEVSIYKALFYWPLSTFWFSHLYSWETWGVIQKD